MNKPIRLPIVYRKSKSFDGHESLRKASGIEQNRCMESTGTGGWNRQQTIGGTGRNAEADLKDLIRVMVKALVDAPERVVVTEKKGDNTLVIEVRVAEGDLGKVIGRKGRTAQAMRIILTGTSSKMKRRCVLAIVE